MRTISRAIPVLIALSAIPVEASFLSGNDLLDQCITPRGQSICLGYVMGVADFLQRKDPRDWHICLDKGISAEQIKDAVVRYLKTHIASRHVEASGLVANAIFETFPCPGYGIR